MTPMPPIPPEGRPLPDRGWSGLEDYTRESFLTLRRLCLDRHGIVTEMSEGWRSGTRQGYLYSLGRWAPNSDSSVSRPLGSKVTNAKPGQSLHQSRRAFDVYCARPTPNTPVLPYDPALLALIGSVGVELGLEWGGNWKTFVDMPHFSVPVGWSKKA